jgi:hypothetical protein
MGNSYPRSDSRRDSDRRELDKIAKPYRDGERMILPRLDGNDVAPIMLWWLLLYGLSIAARYDPELWVRTISVDRSPVAVKIEAALDVAIDVLPGLVVDALAVTPLP